jgi:hypothetical protein
MTAKKVKNIGNFLIEKKMKDQDALASLHLLSQSDAIMCSVIKSTTAKT